MLASGDELLTCTFCPFRAACIQLVKPAQSSFDGVAGGRLWISGRVYAEAPGVDPDELEESKLRAVCGTDTGWRQHRSYGEEPCPSCRSAMGLFNEARKFTTAAQAA
ncbi:hypothetical protein GCM10020367_20650 [Streptomyces sannanensis]|uniref:4Fe-4S Wbl-type domain-containing protein n=1 Tax=Streptomyces sannanensis TaxID=285536 RepID=A0ABP6S9I1_9ACTN